MATGFTRCQFIDEITKVECETWYPYVDGQKFCNAHNPSAEGAKEVIHIPRTVTLIPDDHIQKLNAARDECLKMSIPDLVNHIKDIESQIRDLERHRRAATMAKRVLEDALSDDERAALRAESEGYKVPREVHPSKKKSPEEKAKNRKEGSFSQWAAKLGMKSAEELMLMDDDELAAKIAKYKASKK